MGLKRFQEFSSDRIIRCKIRLNQFLGTWPEGLKDSYS